MIISVDDFEIAVMKRGSWDYFSLTGMLKAKLGSLRVANWLRTRRTLEMLFAWETEHNPTFNWAEIGPIMDWMVRPGAKNFKISVKEWIALTHAIGLLAWPGMYGGTFGQTDIALEFAGWVDPLFRMRFEEVLKGNAQKKPIGYKN